MPKELQRENRYVVFKRSDMRKYLSQSECKQVEGLALHICLSREGDGKHPLNCLVVESDWPEFEPTWGAIEARVTGAEQPTSHAFDDSATIAGLKSAVSHLSACLDEFRALLVEVNDVCGRDGHGGPLEDGESELIDRVRAALSMAEASPQEPKEICQ